MNELKKSKELYDNVPIPAELNDVVRHAIEESDKKKGGISRTVRIVCSRGVKAAAVLLVAVAIFSNSNESFAMDMQKIPVLGTIVKLLTVCSYENSDGDKQISVDIPGVEFLGDETSEFSKDVNEKISNSCSAYAMEAQNRADEYKEAFIATGGTEAEWAEHHIEIKVWYEIKSQTDEYLSFVVSGTESWTSAYAEIRYYNLNLKNAQYLTLEDVLGNDYISIANSCIKSQIDLRTKEAGNQFWTVQDGGFQTIDDEVRFYLNERGDPVIVFEKYEIGPGSMGEVEFEIER